MAYTAPLGNAVDFTATGESYAPPSGNAVNFGPRSFAKFALPIVVSVGGAQGVNSSVEIGPAVVVSGSGEQPVTAIARMSLPVSVDITGNVPCSGFAALGSFGIVASGIATVGGTSNAKIPVSVEAVGVGGKVSGEAYFRMAYAVVYGEITSPIVASVGLEVSPTVEAVGKASIVGKASFSFTPLASATAISGATGKARFIPIKAGANGRVGRTGSCRVGVMPKISSRGGRGVSGAISCPTFSVSARGRTLPVFTGVASVELTALVSSHGSTHIDVRRDQSYVKTGASSAYVR